MQLLLVNDHHPMMIFILILLLAAVLSSEGQPPPVAKPNCATHCGDVIIPYPFGIGPNEDCYLNKWFLVDCPNKTKPFLRHPKLEVLSISVDNRTLRVHSPVSFFCRGNATRQAADLKGSPLVYSQKYNKFTAVSCGFLALVRSDESIVGGCRSVCETGSENHQGCDIGVNCCQTTIPPYLTNITADLLVEPNRSPDCDDYAFLVDNDWFENTASSNFSAIKSMVDVPVVLEWSLIIDNFTASFLRFCSNLYVDPWPFCVNSTTTSPNTTISCYCPVGFQGNPYLLELCQDINECERDKMCRGTSTTCVNFPGSYNCSYPFSVAPVLSSEGQPPPVAKPNCATHCGDVIIPYPFGIGPNEDCYLNEWFLVDCPNKTKPFLRHPKLEVLSISVDNRTLRVHSPVSFFCRGNATRQAADLKGSPLVYSQKYNKFTAVSCGFLALVRSDESIVGGCRSVCETGSENHQGCDIGVNCCQTTIAPYLTNITADLLVEPNRSPDCDDYAFLVDNDWFENTTSSNFSAIKSMVDVPVVLEWSLIIDSSSSTASFLSFPYNSSASYSDPTPFCLNSTTTSPNTTISCYCPDGFQGNPYLLESCQDINECERYYMCPWSNFTCVNFPGSYGCSYDNLGYRRKTKLKWILGGLGIGVGLLLLLIGAWLGYRLIKKRNDMKRKEMFFKRNGGLLLEQQLSSGEVNVDKIKLFKSKELEKSTDNFNNDRILGQGGQGTVYKGMLPDGKIVAVKKSKKVDESKLSEFINEVVILSQINHRNVVKILGCCLETEVPLLVYEFIPNGTLSQYIQEQIEEFPLTWEKRLRIAMEIAGALSYLHSAASFPIFHRDIKSTNILLDEKYRAKVADFGTSRSVGIDQTHLTTHVHGTFGYLDPEYFQSSQFTEKSDVYSFGVVLVELLTGQKPIRAVKELTEEEEYKSLASYFINSMQENRLFDILDAQVVKEGSETEIRVVANLARRCLNLNGKQRPTMREVTAELEAIQMSKKASDVEVENYEEVEFVRTESIEPWDVVSSSGGTGSSVLDGGSASSSHEIPILPFKSW